MLALERAIPAFDRLESLIAATDDARKSALRNLAPELEHLEHALAEDRARQRAILHGLIADNRLKDLEGLAAEQRAEFDALDFVGQLWLGSGRKLWGPENFHDGVLRWLLDPKQSHGLGERFLEQFLRRSGMRQADQCVDWSATDVTREWEHQVDSQKGYLDILIVNEAAQVLCAIENKTFSSEHDEQLTRYRKALEADYSTFTKYYLFLTPFGTKPLREEEQEYWKPFTYSMVFEIVQQIVENNDESTNADVRAFLRQYATTLRRNLMPDTSVSQLARRIYLKHRQAMELLIANQPDWVAEAKPILKKAIEQQPEWKLDQDASTAVRFRAGAWDEYKVTRTGDGWESSSDALVLFEFNIREGKPYLRCWMSPASDENKQFRQNLFEAIRQHPTLFRPRERSIRDSWIRLHTDKDKMLDENDLGVGWDDGTTRAKIEEWVANFAATRFRDMNEVIVSCLREYEAEGRSQ